ncbi:MAG TPA: class I SAM-dependent methyltransferase [Candidatus Saccharimonadia bacterium]
MASVPSRPQDLPYESPWVNRADKYAAVFAALPSHQAVVQAAALQAGAFYFMGHAPIADIGCGPGHLGETLLRNDVPAGQLHSFDPSSRMRELAALRGMFAEPGSLTQIPLPDGVLGVAVSVHNLYLLSAAKQADAMAELARVVRSGGRLVLVNSITPDLGPLVAEFRALVAAGRLNAKQISNLEAWAAAVEASSSSFTFLPAHELADLVRLHFGPVRLIEPVYLGLSRLIVAVRR